MSNRFKKKVAVITGAAQGIGKRVAEKMAKEKGTLVLVDRSELVHDVAKDIASYERFLRDHLLQRPHVHEAHSHIAMSEVKRTTELPLD